MRKIRYHKDFVFYLFLFSFFLLKAQNSKKFAHQALAEKVYLHIDNEVYTTNKTIWFKAILVNAVTHKTTNTSGVLYVELVDSANRIIESKLVKIAEGIGSGFFDLDRSFEEGTYMIRAYTEWNKNFDNDFVFKKYIQVYAEEATEITGTPIQNIRVVDSTLSTQKIRADFFPELLDSNHENKLMIMITEKSGSTDTLYLRPKNKEEFSFEYDISKNSEIIDLAIRTSNGQSFKTRFSTRLNSVDLQFFPEGGELVKGLLSKVGFKAINTNGLGVPVEGVILDKNNDTIVRFQSNTLGMGSLKLEPKTIGRAFKAVFKTNSNDAYKEVELPLVQATGYVMAVEERDQNLLIGVSSNIKTSGSITLIGTCRGYEYFKQEAQLIDGRYIYVIPKFTFPEGVIMLTLIDEMDRPKVERLYFNERLETRMNLDLSLDKSSYNKRDAVLLNVKAKSNSDRPLRANVSVLTVDSDLDGKTYDNRINILSYLLLSSDLKGTIESPGSYFSNEEPLDIDALMLTQGWRSYKYNDDSRKLNYIKEGGLRISGIVNTKNKKDKLRNLDLMLMTLDNERAIYTTPVNVPGNFSIDIEDIYGDYREVALQSAQNTKRDQKELIIAVNRKRAFPPKFEYKNQSLVIDSLTQKIINEYRDQKIENDTYQFNTYGTTVLDEVVLTGYNMTPKRQEVFDRYGPPDIVIKQEEMQAKEKNWNWGLMSVLYDFFPDKVRVDPDAQGNLIARVIGESTLYIVDGIPVRPDFYSQLQYMSIDEVTSFEILETSKNYAKLYIQVNGPGPYIPNFGGIISIYTRRGIGLQGALSTSQDSYDRHKIQVFAADKEFYVPEYDVTSFYEDSKPDTRLPIYWKPQVETDENGKANVKYYHSDDTGSFKIIVEGIASDGQIGYQIINYSVRDQSN